MQALQIQTRALPEGVSSSLLSAFFGVTTDSQIAQTTSGSPPSSLLLIIFSSLSMAAFLDYHPTLHLKADVEGEVLHESGKIHH